MMKNERLLNLFVLLQNEKLSTKYIMQRLPGIEPDEATNFKSIERLITRSFKYLKKFGFEIEKTSTDYRIKKDSDWTTPLARLIKEFLHEKVKKHIYGDIDTLTLVNLFEARKWTAEDFLTIADTLKNSCKLSFTYLPQHPDTAERVKKIPRKRITDPKGKVNIEMIPHYLVFRAQKILILGEVYYKNEIHSRHYLSDGIVNIKPGNQSTVKKLKIKPDDIYRYSVGCWSGGILHKLKIQISDLCDSANVSYLDKTVNGEEEIIREMLASNGVQKIIHPPDIFYQKAAQMGISPDKVFTT